MTDQVEARKAAELKGKNKEREAPAIRILRSASGPAPKAASTSGSAPKTASIPKTTKGEASAKPALTRTLSPNASTPTASSSRHHVRAAPSPLAPFGAHGPRIPSTFPTFSWILAPPRSVGHGSGRVSVEEVVDAESPPGTQMSAVPLTTEAANSGSGGLPLDLTPANTPLPSSLLMSAATLATSSTPATTPYHCRRWANAADRTRYEEGSSESESEAEDDGPSARKGHAHAADARRSDHC
ncbi:hypothetical protein C8R44DRAFT_749980 [Mycena epipterygia]|nr:hypothetical protein C8R44DRAFT_749980 [Mycena epipterygia]